MYLVKRISEPSITGEVKIYCACLAGKANGFKLELAVFNSGNFHGDVAAANEKAQEWLDQYAEPGLLTAPVKIESGQIAEELPASTKVRKVVKTKRPTRPFSSTPVAVKQVRAKKTAKAGTPRRTKAPGASGRIGVYEFGKDLKPGAKGFHCFQACARFNGKRRTKSFSVKKHGRSEARRLAIVARKDFEKKGGI